MCIFSNMSFAFKVLCGGEANTHDKRYITGWLAGWFVGVRDRLVCNSTLCAHTQCDHWFATRCENQRTRNKIQFNRIAPFGFDGFHWIPAKLIPYTGKTFNHSSEYTKKKNKNILWWDIEKYICSSHKVQLYQWNEKKKKIKCRWWCYSQQPFADMMRCVCLGFWCDWSSMLWVKYITS